MKKFQLEHYWSKWNHVVGNLAIVTFPEWNIASPQLAKQVLVLELHRWYPFYLRIKTKS